MVSEEARTLLFVSCSCRIDLCLRRAADKYGAHQSLPIESHLELSQSGLTWTHQLVKCRETTLGFFFSKNVVSWTHPRTPLTPPHCTRGHVRRSHTWQEALVRAHCGDGGGDGGSGALSPEAEE